MPEQLHKIIAGNLDKPAPPAMHALGLAAREIYGANVIAVLGYGSCLRDNHTDGKMADLYVLLQSCKDMPDAWPLRIANAILPPNVYYLEIPYEGKTVRAKYATLTLAQFEKYMHRNNPYLWARFSQPSALFYVNSAAAKTRIIKAIEAAITTMTANTLPLMPEKFTSPELWSTALGQTYRTEWRAEGKSRAGDITAANAEYYKKITPLALNITPDENGFFSISAPGKSARAACRRRWQRRRFTGRLFATARLVKAAFTFSGGIEYLLWKIARHSGVKVTPTDFQRRHPILGAPSLAWKVYRMGGFS